jgi:hypothetical protein
LDPVLLFGERTVVRVVLSTHLVVVAREHVEPLLIRERLRRVARDLFGCPELVAVLDRIDGRAEALAVVELDRIAAVFEGRVGAGHLSSLLVGALFLLSLFADCAAGLTADGAGSLKTGSASRGLHPFDL